MSGHTPERSYAGTLYLLHLERPLGGACNQFGRPKAAHYLGYTVYRTPRKRIALHRRGVSGSKYMKQAHKEGIKFFHVRTWTDASRDDERRLKNWKNLARFCPRCARSTRP